MKRLSMPDAAHSGIKKVTSQPMFKGMASRPVKRSETARLKRRSFPAFRRFSLVRKRTITRTFTVIISKAIKSKGT